MTAIGGGLAAVPPVTAARDVGRRPEVAEDMPQAADAPRPEARTRDANAKQEIDPAQLAMIPERFWPYDIWLREKGWTREAAADASEDVMAISGVQAYRDTNLRSGGAQRAELETALAERNAGAPPEIADAVRLIGALRDERGGVTGLARTLGDEEDASDEDEATDGEKPKRAVDDAEAARRLFARHGSGGPVVEQAVDGRTRLGSFALSGLGGDHAVRHDGATGAVSVWRGSTNITASVMRGKAFG